MQKQIELETDTVSKVAGMAIDSTTTRHGRRSGRRRRRTSDESEIAESTSKFKRRQSGWPCDSPWSSTPMVLFVLVAFLLLLGHCPIAPVSSAAIAAGAVTNEPPATAGLVVAPTTTTTTTSSSNRSMNSGVNSVPSTGSIPSPIIRLPSNSLIKYTAYRDVSILHFQVPRDTRTLHYSFRAHEEFKSAFCEYQNWGL